ncbi:MAG: DUF4430 domain-containing protein [bacterium]|nr:DUF4430 domain-containing protein [bacterium]
MERMVEFVKEHIRGIAVAASIVLVLAVVFVIEEPKPRNTEPGERIERRETAQPEKTQEPSVSEAPSEGALPSGAPSDAPTVSPAAKVQNGSLAAVLNQGEETEHSREEQAAALEYSEQNGMEIDLETGMDEYNTEPVPEGMPLPQEPEEVEVGDTVSTCTLSVSCHEILENMDKLNPEKAELVPADGYILPPTEVSFNEGESVFNVLRRTMKEHGIHMEFVNTPMYNSAYIEGINNLYEFDCGERSGWTYRVNGWYPNYGCSRYVLQPGDIVEWIYTCG